MMNINFSLHKQTTTIFVKTVISFILFELITILFTAPSTTQSFFCIARLYCTYTSFYFILNFFFFNFHWKIEILANVLEADSRIKKLSALKMGIKC